MVMEVGMLGRVSILRLRTETANGWHDGGGIFKSFRLS
jgi:hypothetical protein